MKTDVNEIVKNEIDRLNVLFQMGAKAAEKDIQLFTPDDYTYLRESQEYFGTFSVPLFLSYSVLKDIEYRVFNPYPGTVWYWMKDADINITKDFLPRQSKLIYDTLNAYVSLLKSEHYLQALIVFRSYIEYSSQFYASLLDYEFFKKYTGSDLLDEDYKKLWFSVLKPSKVVSKIKEMHTEIDHLLEQKELAYTERSYYMSQFRPFDSKLRGYLYGELSGLAHGSYFAVVKYNELKLYAMIWLCSTYLVESQMIIDGISSVYFNYTYKELMHKWVTNEVYMKARLPQNILYMDTNT